MSATSEPQYLTDLWAKPGGSKSKASCPLRKGLNVGDDDDDDDHFPSKCSTVVKNNTKWLKTIQIITLSL